jgi:hypothetical protein
MKGPMKSLCWRELDFQLEFDPYFTAQGRHIPTDAAFTVDGQTVRVSSVDVYPSHMVDQRGGRCRKHAPG